MGFGGSGVCACRWLLLASTLLWIVTCVVGDRPSSMCVQLGQIKRRRENPVYTIGTENFTTVNIADLGNYNNFDDNRPPLTRTCETSLKVGSFDKGGKGYIDYCPKNVEIRTYLVRQNGRILRGWLHTEIELKKEAKDTMEFIYVQVRDDQFAAIGEFVTDEAEQCKTDKEGLVQPTPYQVYPCSAIGFREAKASSALFVANRNQYENKQLHPPYITEKDLTSGIHFTWKLSEFWCSRHWRFRFEANILTTKNKRRDVSELYRIAADYWLHPAWFGAADIKVGEEELDCKLPAIDYTTGEVRKEAAESWIQPRATRLTYENDIINPAHLSDKNTLSNCVLDPYSRTYTFGGRCVSPTNNTPSNTYSQGCSNDTKSDEFAGLNFQTYTDYKTNVTQGRLKQCSQICEVPNTTNKDDLALIQTYPKNIGNRVTPKPRVSLHTLRKARGESRNTTFWQTRKFHGNLCVFVAMFIIPVSNFLARYYKETFLAHAHSIPIWLWPHGASGYVALTLIRCSYTAMRENINNWGQSLSDEGYWHRFLGYTFCFIYTIMSTIGGVRILPSSLKIPSVMAHAVTGFALYIMAMYLVISSAYIPGSPSAKCNNDTKLPEGSSQTVIYAYIWVGLDICFHVLMTVFQIVLDRREKIKRPGLIGCMFVPMFKPTADQRNFVKAGFRKIVLIVYTTVSLIMSFLIIVGMFVDDDHDSCELGDFTCNDTQNPFGCAPISMKYFNIVTTERYHVTEEEIET